MCPLNSHPPYRLLLTTFRCSLCWVSSSLSSVWNTYALVWLLDKHSSLPCSTLMAPKTLSCCLHIAGHSCLPHLSWSLALNRYSLHICWMSWRARIHLFSHNHLFIPSPSRRQGPSDQNEVLVQLLTGLVTLGNRIQVSSSWKQRGRGNNFQNHFS